LPQRRARVLVFAFGSASSGIPPAWAATARRSGVNRIDRPTASAAAPIAAAARSARRQGDVVIASVHWGGNWGYEIPREHRDFAHALIDSGAVDVVHGHSSHHALGIEVYRTKLILYGCGDCLNDYEGIGGYEQYRADLSLWYFAVIDPADGALAALEVAPLRMRSFSLRSAPRADIEWLAAMFGREGRVLGTRVEIAPDGALVLEIPPRP
jgi:poly-gamma-glutamate synthesis protein (capsule biosynthesis protein)